MQFNTRVSLATYHSEMRFWTIETETGERATARFLLQATGVLSEPYTPDFKNVGKFKGPTRHTSDWPREPVDLSNKRVGVIGTGATAVQMITEIAKDIGELTVFQRTPNYCKPLHNSAIMQEEQVEIRQNYDEIFKRCENTFGSFFHGSDERSAFDVNDEERENIYEGLWGDKGFAFWLGGFHDIFTDEKTNETAGEFARKKIRERVNDPKVADLLAPTDGKWLLRSL